MERRSLALASCLAAALTWGGVACACGVPSLAAGAASAHADHHDAPASADCERADCSGECAIAGLPPERGPQAAEPPATPPDDGAGMAAHAVLSAAPPLGPRNHSPPVHRAWRAADTPVRRFDRLLN